MLLQNILTNNFSFSFFSDTHSLQALLIFSLNYTHDSYSFPPPKALGPAGLDIPMLKLIGWLNEKEIGAAGCGWASKK